MTKRLDGYDFIRSIAILIVFLGHILNKQATNGAVLLAVRSLSPGLTMSLLGFISAALLSAREYDYGVFLIRRLSRIYIPLASCLFVILGAHALLGKKVITQHALLHLMGLTAFFGLFQVPNKATIGAGLWFITAINIMYLTLPLLQKLFRHPRGFVHLVIFVMACMALNFVMYGTQSTWNVIISFSVGVYLGVNGQLAPLIETATARPLLGAVGLLAIATLSTAHVLPYAARNLLFAFYPLAFVPLLFKVTKRLPAPMLAASGFFAGISYEFYILHFYFINEGFQDFFSASAPLYAQIAISFLATFVLAFVISSGATWLRKVAERYLLAN